MKKIIKKILSWFGPKYITTIHYDPMSFEMDQLCRKNDKIIHTKIDEKFLKKK
jgi:hypothetical protein